MDDGFIDIEWRSRPLRLELQWVGAPSPTSSTSAPMVFLHEGLGSVAMWRDFPHRLCAAAGMEGLVFSRHGYGRSTPRPAGERWPVSFMHAQAFEVLPALFERLDIHRPWLFGHSDGGSIALLHASRFPVAGVVSVAAHVFTEDVGLGSIAAARTAYETTDWREKLARYHADVDSAFYGWNDIWLDPAFRDWNIEAALASVDAPVLVVQGEDDEYGTMAQVKAIERGVKRATVLALTDCGHSPHRDQPDRLIDATCTFIRRAGSPATNDHEQVTHRRPA